MKRTPKNHAKRGAKTSRKSTARRSTKKRTTRNESSKRSTKKRSKRNEDEREKFYVGGGWNNEGKYGIFINIQIDKEKLDEIEPDEYGNIKLTISERREADERSGQDVSVYFLED